MTTNPRCFWIIPFICFWTMTVAVAETNLDNLGFDEFLFVKRKPYSSNHYYTAISNGTSSDRFRADNGIYIYNLKTRQQRPVITAAQLPGGKGFIGKISLSFNAKQVVFDFRQSPQSAFRIWQVNIDGSGLRQVTFSPPDENEKVARWGKPWHTDDIHPNFLPDGGIIFSSTRCEHTILCGGSAALVAPVLHRIDQGRIEQLSRSLVSEFCPVVLDDGRIMYHRWEYVDKGARVCKTLWSMNPDGSNSQELYGNVDDTTTVYMYPQPVPGNPNRLVCVGTCHYPQGGCLGAVMLIDLANGLAQRGPDPDQPDYIQGDKRFAVTNLTPEVFVQRRTEPGWYFRQPDNRYRMDRNGTSGHLYTHPWPVDQDHFLVSYKANPKDHYQNVANAYSIALLDSHGQVTPILSDPQLSCWHPIPLKSRPKPPVIRSVRPQTPSTQLATCIVLDVYQGMENISRGEVKWLRVNEAVPRYWSTGRRWSSATSSSSWKGALWPRVQWGIVPVEKDGSACFKVPADRNIFFQALDKDYRELQRERTYINYRPGETRSCVGCHRQQNRGEKLDSVRTPLALKRPPSELLPQPCDRVENGGSGLPGQVIHYPADIQPIFDAKCISCHGNKKTDGDLNLSGTLTTYYNISYEQLASKELAGPLLSEFQSFKHGDQGNYNGAFLPPKSLGTYQSKLFAVLTDPNCPVNIKNDHTQRLTSNERMILTRWIDSNYQFYGSYYGRHHAAWTRPDPKVPEYNPKTDFRRKASFAEAISPREPFWHR